MSNIFFRHIEGTRKDKYVTKLNDIVVCNACYAITLGYLQMRFKQLKKSQQLYGRIATVHRNICKMRESIKVSAIRECLTIFINEVGCLKPNQQLR